MSLKTVSNSVISGVFAFEYRSSFITFFANFLSGFDWSPFRFEGFGLFLGTDEPLKFELFGANKPDFLLSSSYSLGPETTFNFF